MEPSSKKDTQKNPLGAFLYTQNPFYLISCGFVLYGLQVAATKYADQFLRTSFLSGSLAIYAALMAITAILVVRWGKIWDDARTILLVVVIALLAVSVSADELCIANRSQALLFLGFGGIGAFVISELVFALCKIRFVFWHRLPYYAMLAVFFITPLIAGYFRTSGGELQNLSPLVFSILAAGALLLLIPAVRGGEKMAQGNGTPWNWPLYPLSLFVILAVIAGLRSHAIWMSFGNLRGEMTLEPLLLVPLGLAILTLMFEYGLAHKQEDNKHHDFVRFAMIASPAALLGGVASFAKIPMQFDAGLATYGGSAMTVTLALMAAFYVYACIRKVPGAAHAIALTVFAMSMVGKVPLALQEYGIEHWMAAVAACGIYYVLCLMLGASERLWLGFTAMTAATLVSTGVHVQQTFPALIMAAVWCLLMAMWIGWMFDTQLAKWLRTMSAAALVIAAVACCVWHFSKGNHEAVVPTLIAMTLISAVYLHFVRRSGWIYVTSLLAACALIVGGSTWLDIWMFTSIGKSHWQLKTGLACFCVGVVITSAKTGVYHRNLNRVTRTTWMQRLRPGF